MAKTLVDKFKAALEKTSKKDERNHIFQTVFAVALADGSFDQAKLIIDHAKTLKNDKALDLKLISKEKLDAVLVPIDSDRAVPFPALMGHALKDHAGLLAFDKRNGDFELSAGTTKALEAIQPYGAMAKTVDALKADTAFKLDGKTELKIPESHLAVIQRELTTRMNEFAKTGKHTDAAALEKFRTDLQTDLTKWTATDIAVLTKKGGDLHKSGYLEGFYAIRGEIDGLEAKPGQKLGGSAIDLSDPDKAALIKNQLTRELQALVDKTNKGEFTLQDLETKRTELGKEFAGAAALDMTKLSEKYPDAAKAIAPGMRDKLKADIAGLVPEKDVEFGGTKIKMDPATHALIMNELNHRITQLEGNKDLTAGDVAKARTDIAKDLKSWSEQKLEALQTGDLKEAAQRIRVTNEGNIDQENAALITGQPASGITYKIDKGKVAIKDKAGKDLPEADLLKHQKALVDLITAARRGEEKDPAQAIDGPKSDKSTDLQAYIDKHHALLTKSEKDKPALLDKDGKLNLANMEARGIQGLKADGSTESLDPVTRRADPKGLGDIDIKHISEVWGGKKYDADGKEVTQKKSERIGNLAETLTKHVKNLLDGKSGNDAEAISALTGGRMQLQKGQYLKSDDVARLILAAAPLIKASVKETSEDGRGTSDSELKEITSKAFAALDKDSVHNKGQKDECTKSLKEQALGELSATVTAVNEAKKAEQGASR